MKKRISLIIILSIAFVAVYFIYQKVKSPEVDTPNIEVDIKYNNFYRDFNHVLEGNFEANLNALKLKNPELLPVFVTQIARISNQEMPSKEEVSVFLNDQYIAELNKIVETEYSNIKDINSEIETYFKFIKKKLPFYALPTRIEYLSGTFSGFKCGITDSSMLVNLEYFLGDKFDYSKVKVYDYQKNTYSKKYLAPTIVENIVTDMVGEEPTTTNLLSKMIYFGKINYLKKQFMPNLADSIVIGYTDTKLEFAEASEGSIWAFIVNKGLLYSVDNLQIAKIISDKPFTPGMPNESPGKIGQWIGWRIVADYMKNNPAVSLKQLIDNTNYQEILDKSKYKPKAGL